MTGLLPLLLSLFSPAAAGVPEMHVAPEPIEAGASMDLPAIPAGWTTVHGPSLTFHGADADLVRMARLSQHAEAAVPRLAKELGVPLGREMHVYIADSDERFRELQPSRAPMWADGVAYPELSLILLRSPRLRGADPTPLETVLRHEIIHVLLGQAFLPNRPPSWLQEGLAQVWSGEVGPETTAVLATGFATGSVMSFSGLARGFPRDANRARLAYAQSADLIGWMSDEYGPDSVRMLIAELAAGTSVEGAVHAATGDFIEGVDQKWRRRLESSGISWGVLSNVDWVMGLGGLLLIVGGIARRRQFHARLAEMEAEEAALDALIGSLSGRRAAS